MTTYTKTFQTIPPTIKQTLKPVSSQHTITAESGQNITRARTKYTSSTDEIFLEYCQKI